MFKTLCCCCILSFSQIGFVFADQALNKESINKTGSDKIKSIVVKPFTAKYTILHKSDPVGTGTRQLKRIDNDILEYSYHTDIEWLIFSDSREEVSTVSLTGNHVTPNHYTFKREGTGRDKEKAWQYDIVNKTATDLKKKRTINVDFPDNIQDKLSYHLQHRINLIANPKQKHFVYPVISTSGSIKNYVYQYEGEEEIILPYGLVKTIKLKREVIEKKRVTYAWFAPELDYLLVKLYQTKGGTEQFEVQLNSVTID